MPDLRETFLTYFDRKGHLICASVPLVPEGDPTLLFTSAGMVPFKPYFLGLKKGISRATSCQKCLRTTDIDRVGATIRHLTFFEMLGNFSLADYFKAEAVHFAWEFLTKIVGLDPKRLYPTVFKDDEEAAKLWGKQGILNPVARLGEESNFWAMGPTGPCGPCSEIYYDLGPERSCGRPDCAVGCDCDRYIELWNLVFMQFERMEGGELRPLPFKNIDTGMGLERLAMVVEGKASPFETDLMSPVVEAASGLLGVSVPGSDDPKAADARAAYRIIADHARAAAFLASEGLIPSNVERGYVLRRLIRRAARYGKLLGAREPFLSRLAPSVIEIYGAAYPALADARTQVEQTLLAEEERFLETLEKGERELQGLLAARPKVLAGEAAFKLYDTFGFPLELTREIAGRLGVEVDEAGFAKAQAGAAEIARAGWKGSGEKSAAQYEKIAEMNPGMRSEFVGYHRLSAQTYVTWVIRCGAPAEQAEDETLKPGDEGEVILARTPFYPESGGQVGDVGVLLDDVDESRELAVVHETRRPHANLIVHRVTAKRPIKKNTKTLARVDSERRRTTAYHHTATHLLGSALRRVLGQAVRQAGSLVEPDRLRFDFTYGRALSDEQIAEVERIVRDSIRRDLPVAAQERPAADIQALKPVTLLGESYGARPRFLLVGEKGWTDPMERFSLELCGGTHVASTGEIQDFKIVKESAVAAGIRRIEAVAGPAFEHLQRIEEEKTRQALRDVIARYVELTSKIQSVTGRPYRQIVRNVADADAAAIEEVKKSLGALRELEKILRSELNSHKQAKLSQQAKMGQVLLQVGSIRLSVQKFAQAEIQTLRAISDQIKREMGSGVVLLGTTEENKLSFVVNVTQDLVGKGVSAAEIAREVALIQKGRSGGRADFAQGGGPDADWEDIVNRVKELVLKKFP
ncbi:MAG: alanine--tRNA ligase [Elusimicrobia bacterium]|nr:alanine--tRNA ligase [Elusimicrobiota bacterium]